MSEPDYADPDGAWWLDERKREAHCRELLGDQPMVDGPVSIQADASAVPRPDRKRHRSKGAQETLDAAMAARDLVRYRYANRARRN